MWAWVCERDGRHLSLYLVDGVEDGVDLDMFFVWFGDVIRNENIILMLRYTKCLLSER